MFDPRQFDSNGNILVDAPAQANRTAVLPLGVARSGLQAFFSRTFLGLRPKDDFDPTHGLRLYSSIGRTIIFNMDVDHQGWLTTDLDVGGHFPFSYLENGSIKIARSLGVRAAGGKPKWSL